MASAHAARLLTATDLGAETRLLDFELPSGEALGFVGGQYLIFHTNVPLPGGKTAKRAYSILSPDTEQNRFQIAVRRIGSGPGSSLMHGLSPGAEIVFSGPWGQYLPDDARPRSSTLVFVTDTGITAALGLMRGAGFAPQLSASRLIWFVESADYFLPASFVRDLLPHGLKTYSQVSAPPIGHPERESVARTLLARALEAGLPESAFLSGDGTVLYALREQLIAAGVPESGIRLETFFNHKTRKAPA